MALAERLKNWRSFAVRNRVKIFDLGFIVAVVLAATLFAFEVDVFENEPGVSQKQETIELDEVLMLSTLTVAGVLLYTWRRAREHKRENARRLAAEQEVLQLALHDPLTGLPNRRQFDDALKGAIAALPTAPEAHAVFMLDLNGFKKINDIHGHPVGDQVLMHVGARLMRAVRDGDLVARLGGDEFAVLARNVAGAEGATSVALRIIEALAPPVSIDGVRHTVGGGIGVALAPHDGDTPEELMRRADIALYRAKTERRSTVRFFEAEMDARLHEREDLERALAADVADQGFELAFRPTRGPQGAIVGFDALATWRHPVLGAVDAERFIPIAEETGQLSSLTEVLLRKACAAAGDWPKRVRLGFSLPSALLAEPAFGLRLLGVLGDTGFAPNRLDLQIDEGALIRDTEAARTLLDPLRRAGVSVIADKFGTGYSDLQNLNRLKLDGVKIDQSYVGAMLTDRQAAVMVKALIGIGQGLDLAVIADGVVSDEQAAALSAHGCALAQGALCGEAIDADAARALATGATKIRKRA